jgi:hypothetical protein
MKNAGLKHGRRAKAKVEREQADQTVIDANWALEQRLKNRA